VAVKTATDSIPHIVLESGVLSLPTGRVLTGDFHVPYPEKSVMQYVPIIVDSTIPFSQQPHFFFGTVNNSAP